MGYCLMSNHVHLIAIPRDPDALARTLKQAHGRYATYWNARQSSSGHVWQGRFYSCPLDQSHVWRALRYVELNPVRAKMVARAEQWAWSSAAAHTDPGAAGTVLEMKRWAERWTVPEWRQFLEERQSETEWKTLRQCTHTGRPLGDTGFVSELEKKMLRPLATQKGGRPKKANSDSRQMPVSFVA
jgi:putative transposase